MSRRQVARTFGRAAASQETPEVDASLELPTNVAIRRAFVIEASYGPDAAERRKPLRARHLERVGRLLDSGVIALAGALADLSESVMIANVSSAAEAEALARSDPYFEAGIWIGIVVREFDQVIVERPSGSDHLPTEKRVPN
ncbi:MAG: hypothetical protein HYX52_01920 [Chloroflexi bacterium]|nr:hypothetical protein [Chloroflexota bacterium]